VSNTERRSLHNSNFVYHRR